MIILLEDRPAVRRSCIAEFDREGVAATGFSFGEFSGWIAAASGEDVAAIEAFLIGEGRLAPDMVRELKEVTRAPVLVVCDSRSLDETLGFFAVGVDDVVCRPVHVREILARIHAISQRVLEHDGAARQTSIQVFFDGRDPIVGGSVLSLPRRERRILECLARARSGWLTKRQIFNQVYGLFNEDFDETVIESHVCRLRKRIRQRLGRNCIESQRFLGYRLTSLHDDAAEPVIAAPASLVQARRSQMYQDDLQVV